MQHEYSETFATVEKRGRDGFPTPWCVIVQGKVVQWERVEQIARDAAAVMNEVAEWWYNERRKREC